MKADIKRYHKWVSEQPCVLCKIEGGSQVCHYTGMDGHMFGRGRGKKAHHLMVFPACQDCHSMVDNYRQFVHPDRFTQKLLHSSGVLVFIGQTLISAYEEGVLKL